MAHSLLHNNAIKSVALPAAGAAASTAAIDLGPTGGAHIPNGRFLLKVPAVPALADTKTLTFEVTHCATSGGTYTAVPGIGNMVITGAGGVGVATVSEFRMPIPAHTLQFVKGRFTVLAAGGDNTAVSGTFAIEI